VTGFSNRDAVSFQDLLARRRGWSYDAIGPLVAVSDGLLTILASVSGGLLYHLAAFGAVPELDPYFAIGILAMLTYQLIAWNAGLYRVTEWLEPRRNYGPILASWFGTFLLLALFLFLLKLGSQVSRGAVVTFAGLALSALVGWRTVVGHWVRSGFETGLIQGRRAMLIGTPGELATIKDRQRMLALGLTVVDRHALPHADAELGCRYRAVLERAIERSRVSRADEIILALPWGNIEQLRFVRECLRASPLPVRLLPDHFVRTIWQGTRSAGPSLVDIQRAPLSRVEQAIKRIFDIVGAGAALLFFLPVLLLVPMLIKLDSAGPVIFRQQRRGFNGREFAIFKFRTMRVMENGEAIAQARRHDPRVTRLGRLLRASSIDELPQLLNVLKGDMSLVGPRPHAIAHDNQYGALIGEYALRHNVKPGITGWAQVNGFRGETRHLELMRKRVELDLWYIDNWTAALDVQILLRTIVEILRQRNAY
jgi:undecaprenyl-phosphate galactose phosphotransferase/putative colanic acid biosynthesis UDP-glucose lipid carrier transferase